MDNKFQVGDKLQGVYESEHTCRVIDMNDKGYRMFIIHEDESQCRFVWIEKELAETFYEKRIL